jgi:glucokinase
LQFASVLLKEATDVLEHRLALFQMTFATYIKGKEDITMPQMDISSIDTDENTVIGLDIGKTKVSAGLVTTSGIVKIRSVQPTDLKGGASAIIAQCRQMVHDIITDSSVLPRAIGIGATGIIDRENGVILKSGTIRDWRDIHIREEFEEEFQVPIAVDNDTYAAALGEAKFGAARGNITAVYMGISTSIGFAVIKDGELWRGSHSVAGQIAYLPLYNSNYTAHDLAGGKGLSDRASVAIGLPVKTGDVFLMAKEGKIEAISIVEDAVEATASILAWVQQTIDPNLFILGGGVALGEQTFIELVQSRLEQLLNHYKIRIQSARLVPASLGSDSGLFGAAALAFPLLQLRGAQ